MTLMEKIAAFPQISPQQIKENFTFDEFKFEILGVLSKEPDLSNMSALFLDVEETIGGDQITYNIFAERLALKTLYLHYAYQFDLTALNILVQLEPIVSLDKKLEDILGGNEYYLYIKEAFKEYKVNNGTTLSTVMKYLSTIDMTSLSKELESQIGELKKISNLS